MITTTRHIKPSTLWVQVSCIVNPTKNDIFYTFECLSCGAEYDTNEAWNHNESRGITKEADTLEPWSYIAKRRFLGCSGE